MAKLPNIVRYDRPRPPIASYAVAAPERAASYSGVDAMQRGFQDLASAMAAWDVVQRYGTYESPLPGLAIPRPDDTTYKSPEDAAHQSWLRDFKARTERERVERNAEIDARIQESETAGKVAGRGLGRIGMRSSYQNYLNY